MVTSKTNQTIELEIEKSSNLTKLWLNSKEAAEYLGITVGTLRNLTANGHIPYYKFRKLNRYKACDLDLLFTKKREAENEY